MSVACRQEPVCRLLAQHCTDVLFVVNLQLALAVVVGRLRAHINLKVEFIAVVAVVIFVAPLPVFFNATLPHGARQGCHQVHNFVQERKEVDEKTEGSRGKHKKDRVDDENKRSWDLAARQSFRVVKRLHLLVAPIALRKREAENEVGQRDEEEETARTIPDRVLACLEVVPARCNRLALANESNTILSYALGVYCRLAAKDAVCLDVGGESRDYDGH